MATRSLFATLVGINAYQQCTPLNGCIKDVLNLDSLLRDLCIQQGASLHYEPAYFLAPHAGEELLHLNGAPCEAPTFQNISQKAFAHLKGAKDGDICLFYYSGHGSQVQAPEVFWHTKPDRMNETLVCVDSRSRTAGSRDLIDKELAYLIWDALEGKNVHCVVIMDCCHSGNNMRAMEDDSSVRFRYESPATGGVPLESYLGFDAGFFEVANGAARFPIARYVHIAAARDHEKALEIGTGGLFTGKLVEALRSGATAKSYRDLAQGLAVSVRSRNNRQNPMAFAVEDGDLDLPFLGGKPLAYQPQFEVRHEGGRWILHGGAMQGLSPTIPGAQTLVQVTGGGKTAETEVVEVRADHSMLDGKALDGFDTAGDGYQAVLKRLANPAIRIGLSKAVREDAARLNDLQQAYAEDAHLFYEIDFENRSTAPEYWVRLTLDNQYVLTQAGSEVPLFKRERDAASFLKNVDSVGKWVSASELKNTNSRFGKGDFVFRIERIEGQEVSPQNLNTLKGEELVVQPDEEVIFSFADEMRQPAFRMSIGISEGSALESCYVGVLYLDSRFGITHNLLDSTSTRLERGKSPARLSWSKNGWSFNALPLTIEKEYALYSINEIMAILKIIVSEKPFNLERFRQASLKLDDAPNMLKRNIDFANDNLGEDTDWMVFTNKLRIIGPKKERYLQPGSLAEFGSFALQVPEGFAARAFAATGDDVRAKLTATNTRSLDPDVTGIDLNVMPPPELWGNALTDETAFAAGLSSVADNSLQALELVAQNGETLQLNPGAELVLYPKAAPAAARSVGEEKEEAVIPFGYDEAAGLYFPLGYSDENGAVHIQTLPPPTGGRLMDKEPLSRSLGGSIKLFFKKIFRPKEINRLVLYAADGQGDWQNGITSAADMKTALAARPEANALLLLHGIIGDTGLMAQTLKAVDGLSGKAQFVLTYDYENLSEPIPEIAEALHKTLTDELGFGNSPMPCLCMVTHSMGGLVARWMLEKLGGNAYVGHLMLVGTPSGGSEMAGLYQTVEGLLTHALNVTGPLKLAITGLSFLMKKLQLDPFGNLKQLAPASDVVKELLLSKPPQGVTYSLIGGDTGLLKKGYDGNDPFLKKLAAVLAGQVAYPSLTRFLYSNKPNDLAVTVESMQAVPGLDLEHNVRILPCDHLTYFGQQVLQEELLQKGLAGACRQAMESRLEAGSATGA